MKFKGVAEIAHLFSTGIVPSTKIAHLKLKLNGLFPQPLYETKNLNPLFWKCVIPTIWSSYNSLAWRNILFIWSCPYCILANAFIILYRNRILRRTWIFVCHPYWLCYHIKIFQGTILKKFFSF